MRAPKLAIALALCVLAVLASTLTYSAYLVVGVLADYLGTGRVMAGLLLSGVFARFPWISKGRLRIVGLLPAPARRPVMVSLLALCALHFVSRGAYAPAGFTAFAAVFLLTYPWVRRAVFDRISASVFTDPTVIEGEFREKKD